MERILFRPVGTWLVVLLMLLALAGTVAFGAMVRNVAAGHNRFGRLGEIAYDVASVPATVQELWRPDPFNRMSVAGPERHAGRSGWSLDLSRPADLPPGYLLFSRYDGAIGRSVIELVDLRTGEVRHRFEPISDSLFDGVRRDSVVSDLSTWSPARLRVISPIPMENGDLVFHDHDSPMWRVDACGRTVWRNDTDLFHHGSEPGADGTIWTSTYIEPSAIEGVASHYFDDSITQVSAGGEILYERSLTEAMLGAGLDYLLFTNQRFDPDPLHVNDVQPVPSDGPYWRRGDVFVSLRHLSMLLLFRPSTDEIVWMKQGPWLSQHDVDIVDDHTIAVFNNNVQNRGKGEAVDGTNEILFYDFATGEVTSPYRDLFQREDIRTITEGQFTLLPSGHLIVEETNSGRVLVFAPDGRLVGEQVNRGPDGRIYHVGWSRYLDRAAGDAFLAAALRQGC